MRLQLSVVEVSALGRPRPVVDVVVDAVVGATLADLVPALAECLRTTVEADVGVYAGADRVPEDALIGMPPLLHGAVLHLGAPPQTGQPTGAVEILVTRGPDSGLVATLAAGGATRIGRAAEATIRLADDRVSRVHAELALTASGVTVCDAGSTNGTTLGGAPLGAEAVDWAAGESLELGRSLLELRPGRRPPAVVSPDGLGRLVVPPPAARSLAPATIGTPIRMPPPPPARRAPSVPMVALLVPVALAVVLAGALHSAMYLVLGLAGAVTMAAGTAGHRRQGAREARRAAVRWHHEREAALALLAGELAVEGLRRDERSPDLAELSRTVLRRDAWLWRNSPGDSGYLELRVGSGQVPAEVAVTEDDGAVRHPSIAAPVTVELAATPWLAIEGSRRIVLGMARSFVGQLAGWHGPAALALTLLTDRPADWEWADRLPHIVPLTEANSGREPDEAGSRTYVVVVDGRPPPRQLPYGAESAVRYLVLAPEVPLPAGTARLDIGDDLQFRLTDPLRPEQERSGRADLMSQPTADKLALGLAPLTQPVAGSSGAIPDRVRLVELIGMARADAEEIAARWSRAEPGRLACVVGADASGAVELDLARDGPHLLVAGTTGAGKSELLQTLVAGLSLENPPGRVGFVLVDYKGGAAFRGCARLPHVLGLVTDLDPHLTRRALRSLRAELKRREHLFALARTTDIAQYQASERGLATPVPRLVVVVDEFRMLAEELPEFVSGLVGVAAVGRSLGVHLVLATQRPAGVVSAQIKANVNLRIGLRMRDDADSLDVLDVADAARLPSATPGRALVRAGGGPARTFQTALVTCSAPAPDHRRIRVRRASAAPEPAGPEPETDAEIEPENEPETEPQSQSQAATTDLELLADATVSAALASEAAAVAAPWLVPLPRLLELSSLVQPVVGAAYGLVDLPDQQAQPALTLDLQGGGGHIGVIGGPRSGRTSVLRTLAVAAGRLGEVQVYAVESRRGGLSGSDPSWLRVLTCVADEPWRTRRLLERLRDEARRRRASRGASEGELRTDEGGGAVLLLVDDWDQVIEAAEQVGDPQLPELVLAVLKEGAGVGLHAVLTGGRAVLSPQVGGTLSERFLLTRSAPQDAMLAGIPADRMPHERLPGRAVRMSDRAEVQFAVTDEAARPQRQWQVDDEGISLHPLPEVVRADQVDLVSLGSGVVPVGLGGDTAEPVGLTLSAALPGALVLGRSGSGRSTALVAVARSLSGRGCRVAVVCPLPSPLRRVAGQEAIEVVETPERLREAAREGDLVLVVDDAGALAGRPLEAALCDGLRGGQAGRLRVVAAARTEEAAARFRGLVAELAVLRNGLLLGPRSAADGQVFQLKARRADADVPGRGFLVLGDRLTQVQVCR